MTPYIQCRWCTPGRFSAKQALDHVWTAKQAPAAADVNLCAGLLDNLEGFREKNMLQKVVLHVVARSNFHGDQEIEKLRHAFQQIDTDNNGMLTVEEFKKGLQEQSIDLSEAEIDDMQRSLDADGSGEISYTEFLSATLSKKHYMRDCT